jgi:hypothetical protein
MRDTVRFTKHTKGAQYRLHLRYLTRVSQMSDGRPIAMVSTRCMLIGFCGLKQNPVPDLRTATRIRFTAGPLIDALWVS